MDKQDKTNEELQQELAELKSESSYLNVLKDIDDTKRIQLEQELSITLQEIAFQNEEKEKRAAELIIANLELTFQSEEKAKHAAELVIANIELVFQNKEKSKRAAELIIANKELAFQNEEKENRAAELIIANKELAFQSKEKKKRAAELVLANKELVFQNEEKEKRAAELIIANKELAFQNAEKVKRADELIIAYKELTFQNKEKEKRADELIIANKELVFQNEEKEKRAAELLIANTEKEKVFQKEKEKEKQAADKLRESEEKFRNVFEKSPLGKSMTGMDGSLQVNQSFCNILGYTEAELKIKKWQEITHPEDIEESEAIVQSLIEGKRSHANYEKRYIQKNGNIVWTDVNTTLQRDENNNPLYFITSISDITDRKQAEMRLQLEKDRIRTILDLVGDPIFVKDNDHRMTIANRAFYDVFGMDENSVIGYTLAEAVPENERQQFLEVDRRVLDTGITDIREEELTIGDFTRTIITRKSRFIDQSGEKILVGSIHDITDKKESLKTLIESEEKFRMLLNKSPFPMVIADMDSNVEMTNESFKTLIGYSEEDISNVNDWRKHAYPDDAYRNEMKNRWQDETENALRENRLVEPYEAKIRCKDGSDRIFSVIDTKIGNKYLIVYSDLTQRIKAEEERDRFFKVSLDLLCVAGTDGYFKQMNPAWEETLGWTIAELKSKPFFDFIHPEDVGSTLKEVEKLSTGTPAIRFTNRYRCKDDTYKWLTWNTAPFGDVLYAVATDVTDLKNAQDTVTELLGRLNLALEGGNVGVWEWDLATDEIIWDNYMEAMFGLAPGTFDRSYDAFKKRLHPDDVGITVEAIEKAFSGEKSYDIVYRSKWESGEIRFINAKAIVVKDSKGRNERMIGVCYDVTELKMAEQNLQMIADELKRSNQELETFNKMAVGREKRMIELKGKINMLSRELGKEAPYDLSFAVKDNNPDEEAKG